MSRECLVIQSDGIMESTLLQTSKSPWDTPRVQVPAMYTFMYKHEFEFY